MAAIISERRVSETAVRVLGAPKRIRKYAKRSHHRREPLGLDVVDGAVVPAAVRHAMPVAGAAVDFFYNGWKAGVYGKDLAVCPASLLDRNHRQVAVSFEPGEIDAGDAQYIPGDAVYGGLLARHFGHFLLESTTRLWWPILEGFTGPIVFQSAGRRCIGLQFVKQYFDLLGMGDRIIVTGDRSYRFDRVFVPHRSFVIQKFWHENFRIPFEVAGVAAQARATAIGSGDAAGLYLSRTKLDSRRAFGEMRLERAFSRNGFAVVHPELLSLEQQIVLARHHKTIAGLQGSAFHNILFSRDSKNLIYICTDFEINRNYFMIDEMMGNAAAHLYNGVAREARFKRSDRQLIFEEHRSVKALNLDKLFRLLERLDVFEQPWARLDPALLEARAHPGP